MKECILFIDSLYYLSVLFHSCCFYIQHHGGRKEITSMPAYTFCSTLHSILLTRWRNIRLFYTTFTLTIQKKSRFESPILVHHLYVRPWLGSMKKSKYRFCACVVILDWYLFQLVVLPKLNSSIFNSFASSRVDKVATGT